MGMLFGINLRYYYTSTAIQSIQKGKILAQLMKTLTSLSRCLIRFFQTTILLKEISFHQILNIVSSSNFD